MHLIRTLGIAIMAIAATSANPLPEAEPEAIAEPSLISPSLWCKNWDTTKKCCVDQGDKLGCTIYNIASKKCMLHKPNWWCNAWDTGKKCCRDPDKAGCVVWDSKKGKCWDFRKEYFCKNWDLLGLFCKDGGLEGCTLFDYALKRCGQWDEHWWCRDWDEHEGYCKDTDRNKKDCVKYNWKKQVCDEKKPGLEIIVG